MPVESKKPSELRKADYYSELQKIRLMGLSGGKEILTIHNSGAYRTDRQIHGHQSFIHSFYSLKKLTCAT